MSVYTQLSDSEFEQYCANFGISFNRAIPITQGIKNSNWFICANDAHAPNFVLTLFEERKPHEIIKMAQILNQLQDKLPVACPLKAKNGEYIQYHEGKALTVVPVLQGAHPSATSVAMCEQMGAALATLHKTLQTLEPAAQYGVELYPWRLVKEREIKYMPKDEAELMNAIWDVHANLPQDLPKGLCHLDMFADNTLWQFDSAPKLTGLLDFTEVSIEHFVMDIAITINDFCTTWGNAESGEAVNFDHHKQQAFIQGYERVRPLTPSEVSALPVMLAQAAVIFWLLRLNVIFYNREQGRTGDNIMVKNPDLMKRLAAYHFAHI